MSDDVIKYYKKLSQQDCLQMLEKVIWDNKPKCPYCGSHHHTRLKKESRFRCNSCHTAYSVTVKTLFHDTRLPLSKWLLAIHLLLSKQKLSSRELAIILEVNKNTAWYLAQRIENGLRDTKDRQLILSVLNNTGGQNE